MYSFRASSDLPIFLKRLVLRFFQEFLQNSSRNSSCLLQWFIKGKISLQISPGLPSRIPKGLYQGYLQIFLLDWFSRDSLRNFFQHFSRVFIQASSIDHSRDFLRDSSKILFTIPQIFFLEFFLRFFHWFFSEFHRWLLPGFYQGYWSAFRQE